MEFVNPPEQPYANVLLYGQPKTGKTAGACSAPGSVLLLNADLPNATHYAHAQDHEGRVKEVRVEGKATLQEIMAAAYPKSGPGWDTVVIDPVGELHRRLLEEASNMAVRPTMNQYGDVGTMIERFCRFMCEAPCNTVIVCHELSIKDEELGRFERVPFTGTNNPALGAKLMGMVDILGYTGITTLEDGSTAYAAQLTTGQGRRGGDRFAVLGDWRPMDLTEWFLTAGCHTGYEALDVSSNALAEQPAEAAAA